MRGVNLSGSVLGRRGWKGDFNEVDERVRSWKRDLSQELGRSGAGAEPRGAAAKGWELLSTGIDGASLLHPGTPQIL